jgi:class 3 adenylate cyclase
VLVQLRTTLRVATERRGVRVARLLGDAAMLSGIDARGVIACVLDARDTIAMLAPLPLRAGSPKGGDHVQGDDQMGAADNVAARLAADAKPNPVLATVE